MNLLHICNGFSTSQLYNELFTRIEGNINNQYVIAPSFVQFKPKDYTYTVIPYFRNESLLSRIFYGNKLKNIYSKICSSINISTIDIIHAHTLFSDGIPAYRLSLKYNIPYIVAVRNSDINFFFKYLIHYRSLAHKVLINANKIILISPAYKERLKGIIPDAVYHAIKDKIEIIPNGINQKWIDEKHPGKKSLTNTIGIVFSGSFDENKNILTLIEATKLLQIKRNIKLTLVGYNPHRKNKYINNIFKQANKYSSFITILPRKSPDELRALYKYQHIFAMPSKHETFGLVYVEALTQGLPLIYTSNEGFDKFYDDGYVGYSVNSKSPLDIARKLEKIIENYDDITSAIQCLDFKEFNWYNIANKYLKIYRELINNP